MSDTNGFRTMQACDFPETTVFEKYAVKMHNRTWLTDPLAQCTTEACSACLASLSPLSNFPLSLSLSLRGGRDVVFS